MRFKSGREAIEFYVQNKGKHGESLTNSMVLKIIQDGGQRLEFDSNVPSNAHPSWAMEMEVIVDLETIMRECMTREAIMVMLRCAMGISESSMEDGTVDPELKRRTQRKEENVLYRFGTHLQDYDYLVRRRGMVKRVLH